MIPWRHRIVEGHPDLLLVHRPLPIYCAASNALNLQRSTLVRHLL